MGFVSWFERRRARRRTLSSTYDPARGADARRYTSLRLACRD
jgi:hypothetical protein